MQHLVRGRRPRSRSGRRDRRGSGQAIKPITQHLRGQPLVRGLSERESTLDRERFRHLGHALLDGRNDGNRLANNNAPSRRSEVEAYGPAIRPRRAQSAQGSRRPRSRPAGPIATGVPRPDRPGTSPDRGQSGSGPVQGSREPPRSRSAPDRARRIRLTWHPQTLSQGHQARMVKTVSRARGKPNELGDLIECQTTPEVGHDDLALLVG